MLAINRLLTRGVSLLFVSLALVVGDARADIRGWYTLSSSIGPGSAIANVTQGGPGAPLVLELKTGTEPVLCKVRFVVSIPEDEAIIAYCNDLIADSDRVAANSILYFINIGFTNIYGLASGPGPLLDDALQMSLSSTISGNLTLYEVELEITPPIEDDILIYSGIGSAEWAGPDEIPPIIQFADSEPLLGNGGEVLVSSTPSIIIRAYKPAPDCNQNGVDDADDIAQNPSLDCDGSGSLDSCDLLLGRANDCNRNGKPDACDVAANVSNDADRNSVPDECEEVPPVYPIPPVDGGAAGDQNSTAEQANAISGGSGKPGKLVNRTHLSDFLKSLLLLPADDGSLTPMASKTMTALGLLGTPAAALQGLVELLSLPQRVMAYNMLYGVLDFVLP